MSQPAPHQRPTASAGRSDQREPQRLTRNSNARGDNPYNIDPSRIPDGMDYQWITTSILGQTDGKVRSNFIAMQRNHWTPVPAKRHPEVTGWAEGQGNGDAAIEVGGLMLCERPKYLSEEARQEDFNLARTQVGQQFERLKMAPDGTAPREASDGRSLVSANRTYDLSVPDDAQ